MKKLVKWSLVLGIISCLLGAGVITAGAMMGGGMEVGAYLNKRFSGRHRSISHDAWKQPDNPQTPVVQRPGTENGIWFEQIQKLKLEAGPGEVQILTEERENPQDTAIRVETYGADGEYCQEYTIFQEHDTLTIERSSRFFTRDRHDWEHIDSEITMEDLIIYLPAGHTLRAVEIEVVAGTIQADTIQADEVELSMVSGELIIDLIKTRNLEADCVAGTMNLELEGKKTDYNYEINCKAGSVTLSGEQDEHFTSLWDEKKIENHAAKDIEINCVAGEITITCQGESI